MYATSVHRGCSTSKNKGVDEDGNYERFSQRVGDGAIPINDSRSPIPSEPEVPKA